MPTTHELIELLIDTLPLVEEAAADTEGHYSKAGKQRYRELAIEIRTIVENYGE